jgi:DNA-binding NtrC family response regulator
VALLVRYFLQHFRRTRDVVTEDFDPRALELLARYRWPGNVRELRNVIERMLVLHGNERLILPEFLPEEFHGGQTAGVETSPTGTTLEDKTNAYERQLIAKALEETHGVQTRAAERLGTTRRILRYRMEKLGINPDQWGRTEPNGGA